MRPWTMWMCILSCRTCICFDFDEVGELSQQEMCVSVPEIGTHFWKCEISNMTKNGSRMWETNTVTLQPSFRITGFLCDLQLDFMWQHTHLPFWINSVFYSAWLSLGDMWERNLCGRVTLWVVICGLHHLLAVSIVWCCQWVGLRPSAHLTKCSSHVTTCRFRRNPNYIHLQMHGNTLACFYITQPESGSGCTMTSWHKPDKNKAGASVNWFWSQQEQFLHVKRGQPVQLVKQTMFHQHISKQNIFLFAVPYSSKLRLLTKAK